MGVDLPELLHGGDAAHGFDALLIVAVFARGGAVVDYPGVFEGPLRSGVSRC